MASVIINNETEICEGVFENFEYAKLIKRNLEEQNPNNSYSIYSGNYAKRPSSAQLYRIIQLEKENNILFRGITQKAASDFISKYYK